MVDSNNPWDEPEGMPRYGSWFEASHPGWCAHCDYEIYRGDVIRADGEGEYLCQGCGVIGD